MLAKNKKRILSMILAVIMVLGMLPMSALAAEAESEGNPDEIVVEIPVDNQEPIESEEPTQSQEPTESQTPDESQVPVESTAPVESQAPAESAAPAESEQPAESAQPTPSLPPEPTPAPTTATAPRFAEGVLEAVSDDGAIIAISGYLPVGGFVTAQYVEVELEDLTVLAAYDIKIFEADGVEYQPGAENPVNVSIFAPVLADVDEVEIYHLENKNAADVATNPEISLSEAIHMETVQTPGETVEFAAEGFSIYIVGIKEPLLIGSNSTINGIGRTAVLDGQNPIGKQMHSWEAKPSNAIEFVGPTNGEFVTIKALQTGEVTIIHHYGPRGGMTEKFTVTIKDGDPAANLKGVRLGTDGHYYVDAKVYLLYQNTIPETIDTSFGSGLFGPSGNNDPYTIVSIDMTSLLENEKVDVRFKGSSWYIYHGSCDLGNKDQGTKALWNLILQNMNQDGKDFFANYFKNNYFGYVLKVEGDGPHIDGIYEVKPAYVTEIYVDGELSQSYFDGMERNFNTDVLGWFYGKYSGIQWNREKTVGTYVSNGNQYQITLDAAKSSGFDVTSGSLSYTEKTTAFYVASYYYTTEKLAPETASFDLQKVDGSTQQSLAGATFQMRNDAGELVCFTRDAKTNTYTYVGAATAGASVDLTVDESGRLRIEKLPQEVFYLGETEAPLGYSIYNVIYKLVVGNAKDDDLSGELPSFLTGFWGDSLQRETLKNGTLTVENYRINYIVGHHFIDNSKGIMEAVGTYYKTPSGEYTKDDTRAEVQFAPTDDKSVTVSALDASNYPIVSDELPNGLPAEWSKEDRFTYAGIQHFPETSGADVGGIDTKDVTLNFDQKMETVTVTFCYVLNADKYTVSYRWSGCADPDLSVPVDGDTYYAGDTVSIKGDFQQNSTHRYDYKTYTFSGWSMENDGEILSGSFEMPEGNVTLVGQWSVASTDSAAYQVQHWKQDRDVNGQPLDTYTLSDTDTDLAAEVGTLVNASTKSYPGYSENTTHAERKASGNVAGDNSLVLKLYYDVSIPTSATINWYMKDVQNGSGRHQNVLTHSVTLENVYLSQTNADQYVDKYQDYKAHGVDQTDAFKSLTGSSYGREYMLWSETVDETGNVLNLYYEPVVFFIRNSDKSLSFTNINATGMTGQVKDSWNKQTVGGDNAAIDVSSYLNSMPSVSDQVIAYNARFSPKSTFDIDSQTVRWYKLVYTANGIHVDGILYNNRYSVEHYFETGVDTGEFSAAERLPEQQNLPIAWGETKQAGSYALTDHTGYTYDATVPGSVTSVSASGENPLVLKLYYRADSIEQQTFQAEFFFEGLDGQYSKDANYPDKSGVIFYGETKNATDVGIMETVPGFTHDPNHMGAVNSVAYGDDERTLKLYYTRNSYTFRVDFINDYSNTTMETVYSNDMAAEFGTTLTNANVAPAFGGAEDTAWQTSRMPSGYHINGVTYPTIGVSPEGTYNDETGIWDASGVTNVVEVHYNYTPSDGTGGDPTPSTPPTPVNPRPENPPEIDIVPDPTPLSPTPDLTDGELDIGEEDVPLADMPELPEEEMTIEEEEVPLGDLPQTGAVASAVNPTTTLGLVALSMSLAAIGLAYTYTRKREEYED